MRETVRLVLPAVVAAAMLGAAVQIVTAERFVDAVAWARVAPAATLENLEFIISPRYPTGAPDGK